MDTYMLEIYPQELSLTSDDAILTTNYLDLRLEIKHDKIHTCLFDKRDAFGFNIVNFPNLSGNIPQKESYGVFVSQLIRYARCCDAFTDFETRTSVLVNRLLKQGFKITKLKNTFSKFAETYYELLIKYNVHVCNTGLNVYD